MVFEYLKPVDKFFDLFFLIAH